MVTEGAQHTLAVLAADFNTGSDVGRRSVNAVVTEHQTRNGKTNKQDVIFLSDVNAPGARAHVRVTWSCDVFSCR